MEDPLEILNRYWGYPAFRPLQAEIVQSVLAGNETMALLPTGGGKSICFQVPGICLDGICLVVSPLIALMKDQVQQLTQRGIKAVALFSGMTSREIDITLDNCIYGEIKFLYVSPERLKSSLFLTRAAKMKINMLAIDEAHCISQWGYDFRPPYLEIAEFKKAMNISKIIALSASATADVEKDIIEKLEMKDPAIFRKSFSRANLSYSAFRVEQKEQKMLQILQSVPGSNIVYVNSRKRTREISDWLQREKIGADFYHAGLSAAERSMRQERWIQNRVRVIVATNAFGMGIDKPDVRSVIHLDFPDSLEAYYQEAGRAGRDEKKAYAVLLYHDQDLVQIRERIERSTVDLVFVKKVYQSLANYYKLAIGSGANTSYDFDYNIFTEQYNLPVYENFHALKVLEDEGLIQITEGYFQLSRLIILISRESLYEFQVSHARLDPIIKGILRLYGGEIFSQYIEIKENEIARLLKVTKDEITKALNLLMQFQVIDYQRASVNSQIHFLIPRQDANNLPIDKAFLDWRKKVALTKAKHVITYAKSKHICRTRMLQAYFNEQTEENCGVCDYCLNKSAERKGNQLIKLIDLISEKGVTLGDLASKLNISPEEVLRQVRLLVEDDLVEIVDPGLIKKKII